MHKVVLSHKLHDEGMKVLDGKAQVVITNNGDPKAMLPELLDADGLIIRIGSIDRETMLAAKNLKVIGRPGVGVDDVDVKTATELGIPVVIVPGANTLSVAEHALTFILSLLKDMPNCDAAMRRGDFGVRNLYKAVEAQSKTLGLVGCGHIGTELARLATALGMKVCIHDPFIDAASVEAKGWSYAKKLEDVLAMSDAVSLHVPLTEATRNFIGAAQFAIMKDGAVLVNCARGGIVDEAALAEALKSGKLGGAATDVFSSEPVPQDHPLFSCPGFLATPHMAGLTREAAIGVATGAARGVLAVMAGEKWEKVCNPKAYDHPRWQNK